uniref:Aspartyl/asparaginy/proline hydroxylase domain-containing protein n=1 Tax=Haptolina brevifila TaxID=156173 RepID=A0A7S2JTW6_9EUKA
MDGFMNYDVMAACRSATGRAELPAFCAVLTELGSRTDARIELMRLSRIQPGTIISLHTGLHNTRWRLHMGLQVPSSYHAHMRVGGRTVEWQVGKAFVFDDSFEHEVGWEPPVREMDMRASEARIILIVDFRHPDAPSSQPVCPPV